jgi:L-ribulose-5-phosphate 4-epimerase
MTMNSYISLREQAVECNRQIPGPGLAIYTLGNFSAYDSERGVFAIKPSGVAYVDLAPDFMVAVDLDGKVLDGTLKPFSDNNTHAVLHRCFKEIGRNDLSRLSWSFTLGGNS